MQYSKESNLKTIKFSMVMVTVNLKQKIVLKKRLNVLFVFQEKMGSMVSEEESFFCFSSFFPIPGSFQDSALYIASCWDFESFSTFNVIFLGN